MYVFWGYIFHYLYTKIRIINIYIASTIYYFFVLETLKIFSSYFEIYNCQPWYLSVVQNISNLWYLSLCAWLISYLQAHTCHFTSFKLVFPDKKILKDCICVFLARDISQQKTQSHTALDFNCHFMSLSSNYGLGPKDMHFLILFSLGFVEAQNPI